MTASSDASAGTFVVPAEVRLELDRLATRWAQLPLPEAEARLPVARRTVEDLAALSGPDLVPDLGPAVVVDQLRVLSWDACRVGRTAEVAALLAQLRRDLA